MDKLKGLADKAKGATGGGSSTGSSGTGGGSATGGKEDQYINKGVDMATDKVGLGDKYDKQIGEQANKQYDQRFGGK